MFKSPSENYTNVQFTLAAILAALAGGLCFIFYEAWAVPFAALAGALFGLIAGWIVDRYGSETSR